jgi:ABC-2 type transport system ATP-binding protein
MPHLSLIKHMTSLELIFLAEDMRPTVFDFAHDNGLKTLQIKKNKT